MLSLYYDVKVLSSNLYVRKVNEHCFINYTRIIMEQNKLRKCVYIFVWTEFNVFLNEEITSRVLNEKCQWDAMVYIPRLVGNGMVVWTNLAACRLFSSVSSPLAVDDGALSIKSTQYTSVSFTLASNSLVLIKS